MPPYSPPIIATDGLQLLCSADGRYVLLTLERGRPTSVGIYDDVQEAWAGLDRFDLRA